MSGANDRGTTAAEDGAAACGGLAECVRGVSQARALLVRCMGRTFELEIEDTCGTMALLLWAAGAISGPRGPGCEVEPRLPAEAPSTRAGPGR